ncbi:MAG: hypothetical protein Q7J78_06335 [Clostridiales bacterium]|nr:hypothetical protein [Clostridiales bacterium]
MSISDEVYYKLLDVPIMDPHTHIDASHMSARGLHDILLYHMVISDLFSAGCPNGERLSENPTRDEIVFRIEQAIPYIAYIKNTSCFWGVRIILKDLYGWDEPITEKNWIQIDGIIRKKYEDREWAWEVLKKAGIYIACTDLWRDREGRLANTFKYSLEWAFFARCQPGEYDTALVELENAWGQDVPGEPLPFRYNKDDVNSGRTIKTLDDIKEALHYYCNKIPYEKIVCTAMHLSTDIDYIIASDDEMKAALSKRNDAGVKERDIYASYILEHFLFELEERKDNIIIQFSLGAEPLPYETGSKLRSDSVFQLAHILQNHTSLSFQVFLSCEHKNQSLCTLAREINNLSLAGYWWHNFFPSTIRKVMNERLDMLPFNKQIGFLSDAYCVDWAYAKSIIVRKQLAEVLSGKIEQGQYDLQEAEDIARQIFYESPRKILLSKDD